MLNSIANEIASDSPGPIPISASTREGAWTFAHEGNAAAQRRTICGVRVCCNSAYTAGGIKTTSNSFGKTSIASISTK